tara:strand:- start:35 stop:220 length:186 start_codon:yes stop_codon:yes gene_type:complete
MIEASLIKCINCDIFYEPHNFFKEDIENMRINYKLISCKKCLETIENIKKNKIFINKIFEK